MMRHLPTAVLCVCSGFAAATLVAWDQKRMDEGQFCQKLEACYDTVRSVETDKGKLFDIEMERLSYLVLAAGRHSVGSKRLDALFARIQKDSPTLVVPRFAMSPAELEKLLAGVAHDNADDLTYSAYRRKTRTISELIDDAKKVITKRSGFAFDPTVQVIRSQ